MFSKKLWLDSRAVRNYDYAPSAPGSGAYEVHRIMSLTKCGDTKCLIDKSSTLARFHMMSRQRYWFSKTRKRRSCWCTIPILSKLDSFLRKHFLIPVNFACRFASHVSDIRKIDYETYGFKYSKCRRFECGTFRRTASF